jgi:hypothetical protein
MDVDLGADLDMEDLSIEPLLGSATDERLEIAPGGVCRASAQKILTFAPGSWIKPSDTRPITPQRCGFLATDEPSGACWATMQPAAAGRSRMAAPRRRHTSAPDDLAARFRCRPGIDYAPTLRSRVAAR